MFCERKRRVLQLCPLLCGPRGAGRFFGVVGTLSPRPGCACPGCGGPGALDIRNAKPSVRDCDLLARYVLDGPTVDDMSSIRRCIDDTKFFEAEQRRFMEGIVRQFSALGMNVSKRCKFDQVISDAAATRKLIRVNPSSILTLLNRRRVKLPIPQACIPPGGATRIRDLIPGRVLPWLPWTRENHMVTARTRDIKEVQTLLMCLWRLGIPSDIRDKIVNLVCKAPPNNAGQALLQQKQALFPSSTTGVCAHGACTNLIAGPRAPCALGMCGLHCVGPCARHKKPGFA